MRLFTVCIDVNLCAVIENAGTKEERVNSVAPCSNECLLIRFACHSDEFRQEQTNEMLQGL